MQDPMHYINHINIISCYTTFSDNLTFENSSSFIPEVMMSVKTYLKCFIIVDCGLAFSFLHIFLASLDKYEDNNM